MSIAPVDRRNEQQPPALSTEFGSFSGAFAKATASLSDFKQAGPNDMAPSIDQFTAIGKPGANGAGTITYETKDGAKVTVSENTNPSLYNAVVQSGQTLGGLGGSVAKLLDTAGGGTPPSSAENDAISEDLAKALSDLGGQFGGPSTKPGGTTPPAPTDDQVTTDLTKVLGDVSQALGNPSGTPSAPPADAKTLAAAASAGSETTPGAPGDLTQAFTTALNSLTDPSGSSSTPGDTASSTLRSALGDPIERFGAPSDQKPPARGLDVQADLARALKTVGGQAAPSAALSQVASELGQAFNKALSAANAPAIPDDGKGAALPKALNATADTQAPSATGDAKTALEGTRTSSADKTTPLSDITSHSQVKDMLSAAPSAPGNPTVPSDGKDTVSPGAPKSTADGQTPPTGVKSALETGRLGLADTTAPLSDITSRGQIKGTSSAAPTVPGNPTVPSNGKDTASPGAPKSTADAQTPPAISDARTALGNKTADLTVPTDASGNQPPTPPAPGNGGGPTGTVNLAIPPGTTSPAGASPPPPGGPSPHFQNLESGGVAYQPPAQSPPGPPPPPTIAPSSTSAASAPPPATANGAAGDASNSLTPPANVTDQDAIAKAQGQGYTVATASTTLGPNEAVSVNPPPQATSQNTIQFQTTSGQKLVVDKNTNSALYNQAYNAAYNTNFQANWNAEQNAVGQGYTVATKDTKLADGDSISTSPPPAVVGNGLMQFQTALGQKIVVDKNTNSDLYNQAFNVAYTNTSDANRKADYTANFDALYNAVAAGFTKADANTTIAPDDAIGTNPPPTQISAESFTFETNSGKKIVVDKNTNPALYNQAYNTAFNNQFTASYNQAISQGYVSATASTTVATDDISKAPPPTALSNSIMLFTTNAGQKIMVSKDTNSDLYNQAFNVAFKENSDDNNTSNLSKTAASDKESLIAQAQSQGYTLANAQTTLASGDAIGTNPLPKGIGTDLIEFQTNSGQKIVVDKNTNPDLYNQAYNVYYNNAHPTNGAADFSQIDNSPEGQKTIGQWGTLAGNSSSTPTQEQTDLNRPLAVSQMLSDNWSKWNLPTTLSTSDIAGLASSSSTPPDEKAVMQYISQNPSMQSALDGGGSKGSGNDGIIEIVNVKTFISSAQSSLSTATSSYSTYLKNSPNAEAGGPAQQMAQSAALLQANQQLAYASTSSVLDGQISNPVVGGKKTTMDADSLSHLANDSGLSPALTGAAKMWSQPGMFQNLDTAGNNPATASPDGVANDQNFSDFLTKQAPATDNDALTLLNGAATRNAVAGVDTSKLGADVLANPQNYTGQQKAAVLVQLTDQSTRLAAGIAEGLHQPDANGNMPGNLNADGTEVQAQLQGAITKLSNDPDVAGFLSGTKGAALKTIVGSDPQMTGAVQSYSDKVNDGSALNDQINQLKDQKDSNGKPVPMGVALQNFASGAATADQTLGGDGNVDFAAAAAKSGQLPAIQQYYQNQIVSGAELKTDMANGTDPDTAAQKFAANTAAAQALLGSNASTADAVLAQQNASQTYQDGLLNTGGLDSLVNTFGDGNGGVTLDPQKVTDVLNQVQQNDPSLMTDAAGDPIKDTDIAGLMNSLMGEVRNGAKLPDALNKVTAAFNSDANKNNVSPVYAQGLFHLLSAITTGAVLGARVASFNGTGTAKAGEAAAAIQIGSYLGEAGTKYVKANTPKPALNNGTTTPDFVGPDGEVTPGSVTGADFTGPNPKPPALTSSQLDNLGNAFKTLGGAGSMIGGVVGILSGVGDIKSGDKLDGGFSITSGALGVAGAVGSLVEGASGLLGGAATAYGATEATAAAIGSVAGVVGGVAGVFGAVVGIVGGVVSLAKEGKELGKEQDTYRSQIGTLSQYGITGGQGTSANYAPPIDPQINE